MYKFKTDEHGQKTFIKENGTIVISFCENPDNTDYQAFLKYQAEGGKVYGADEEVPNGQTS